MRQAEVNIIAATDGSMATSDAKRNHAIAARRMAAMAHRKSVTALVGGRIKRKPAKMLVMAVAAA